MAAAGKMVENSNTVKWSEPMAVTYGFKTAWECGFRQGSSFVSSMGFRTTF
ncbi:conserved hypothetical protein [Ricinus communis]|uniref:Uncharacterized protein n=1 Tax=Ricinus communis TaxID=3988 RepID=B9RQ58_RICCO|nr:conserved hypothetical protein [Ricinus communis]